MEYLPLESALGKSEGSCTTCKELGDCALVALLHRIFHNRKRKQGPHGTAASNERGRLRTKKGFSGKGGKRCGFDHDRCRPAVTILKKFLRKDEHKFFL